MEDTNELGPTHKSTSLLRTDDNSYYIGAEGCMVLFSMDLMHNGFCDKRMYS